MFFPTDKCFGVAGLARKVFWHSGSGKKKCFGITGMNRKVLWRVERCKKSILVQKEVTRKSFSCCGVCEKCFGVAGVTI